MFSGANTLEYRRANKIKAVVLLFFAPEKYHALAINHSMALSLEKKDLREAFEKGVFPDEAQKQSAEKNIREFTAHLKSKLFGSFLWVLLASIAAVGLGFYLGALNLASSLSPPKAITFAGSFLAGWATLFELGGGIATMSGEALHEIIHPVIFQVLFIPGMFLALLGVFL